MSAQRKCSQPGVRRELSFVGHQVPVVCSDCNSCRIGFPRLEQLTKRGNRPPPSPVEDRLPLADQSKPIGDAACLRSAWWGAAMAVSLVKLWYISEGEPKTAGPKLNGGHHVDSLVYGTIDSHPPGSRRLTGGASKAA